MTRVKRLTPCCVFSRAVHKATSPIRTVPVIALTPVVADFMGKNIEDEKKEEEDAAE